MNKALLFICVLFLFSQNIQAKKVKFSTDMTGQVLSPNGMHIVGDFQTIAGFPGGDWAANTTPLAQEGISAIYSIIVDIPAFAKYEYKFVNGDQFYEAEFVPVESRVGYNFNDNRWIYVDSLSNDTMAIGAILFAGNAPAGLNLIRFIVETQNIAVSSNGMHVAGNFQNWDPAANILFSFVSDVHEAIVFAAPGSYEYKFYNGNIFGTNETVPFACAVNNNREVLLAGDVVLANVCFSGCVACSLTSVTNLNNVGMISLFPNPAQSFVKIQSGKNLPMISLNLTDLTGRLVRNYPNVNGGSFEKIIERGNLDIGVYFIHILTTDLGTITRKLIFE